MEAQHQLKKPDSRVRNLENAELAGAPGGKPVSSINDILMFLKGLCLRLEKLVDEPVEFEWSC
jgi:hypothetical protein